MATDSKMRWDPTPQEEDRLNEVRDGWADALTQKQDTYRHLSDSSITEFQDLSRDLYNGYVEPWDEIDDEWKDRSFSKRTRHKVMAVLAEYTATSLGVDFSAQDESDSVDREFSKVADDAFEWSTYINEPGDYNLFLAKLDAVITGTAHVMDEIAWESRTVQDIIDIDPETFEVKTRPREVYDHKGPKMTIIPNGEMYPGNVWEHDIQKQPFLIRRLVVPYDRAEALFGNRPNWKYVEAGANNQLLNSGSSRYEVEMDDISKNEVEIVYFWKKRDDFMAIVCSSILMTPATQPFPYPHKRYPISKGVLETFADHRFYWGNSLPFVNKDEQETINTMRRMFVDATKLKVKPPLFTDSELLANTDMIRPGFAAGIDGQQVSVTTIPEITKGVGQSEFNVLQMFERQMDENTIDPLPAGKAPSGDPTATEVRAIVGASQKQQGVSNIFDGHLLVQFAEMRVSNALWFLMKDRSLREISRDLKIRGRKGRRTLRFVDVDQLPDPKEILSVEMKAESRGTTQEFIYVDVASISDFKVHAKISAVPKPPRNGPNSLLRQMTKYRIYAQNPLIDQEQNTRDLIGAMGDDPDELIKIPESQPMNAPAPGQAGQTMSVPPVNDTLIGQAEQVAQPI